MVAAYLWLNAALYLIFAAWMTLLPERTARAVGYLTLSASGHSEFLVVYGGLQLGLAAFFAWCAWNGTMQRAGVVFALCLYAPIVLYRVITVAHFWPVERTTMIVGTLELILLLAAIAIFMRGDR